MNIYNIIFLLLPVCICEWGGASGMFDGRSVVWHLFPGSVGNLEWAFWVD